MVEGDCRLGTMLVEAAVGVSGTLFHLLSLSFSPIEPILILILGCIVDFSTTISQYVKSTAFPASRPRVFITPRGSVKFTATLKPSTYVSTNPNFNPTSPFV
ncbi:hypothetical protein L2E82_42403 [Cichorium intybus]|uniref:Uncharacterized protein n=1 Tax=Cichorium intybus TaxID=13427 RepID=A0ACB8ZL14_CICIN|nr:hypothetical protein L2E82_42403 [Cichorium intybus]